MKILLIAGHGDGDPGAIGCGCKESNLTREVVALVKDQLSKYTTVDVFDTTKNAFATLTAGKPIDFKPYDYVLEVHFNAFNGAGHGTEIYVTTEEKGTTVEQKIVNGIAALGYSNRGVKRTNWTVIHTAKRQGVSAALLEVCFIDNQADMDMYHKSKNKIAAAVTNAIVDCFGLKKGTAPVESNVIYRIQVGAFRNKEYAQDYLKKIKGAGFKDAYIVESK